MWVYLLVTILLTEQPGIPAGTVLVQHRYPTEAACNKARATVEQTKINVHHSLQFKHECRKEWREP